MIALSSGLRAHSVVVFTIPLRAATISGPFISLGIPALSGTATNRKFRLRVRMWNLGISIGFPLIILTWRTAN